MQEQKPQLKTKIHHCEITDQIRDIFTIEKKEYHVFEPHHLDDSIIPDDFNIGCIVGSSGSGKSLLLKEFGGGNYYTWTSKAIASHFLDYHDAEERLLGAGLNSIPMWLAPYNILSTGQKYRADLAKSIKNNVTFDEFTSVIDRNTAISLSNSIQKFIRKKDYKGIVFASVHKDILEYLKPDWVYDTDTRKLTVNSDVYKKEEIYLDKQYIKIENKKKIHFMEFTC